MKNKNTFSIIINLDNYTKYLNETIDSIINQSINFESNVQLILLYTKNNSYAHKSISSYIKKYPHNIIFLAKKYETLEDADEYCLSYATGKYINFIDCENYLSPDSLKEVDEFFMENEEDINLVYIPTNLENEENEEMDENEIIDLNEFPTKIPKNIQSIFMKKELVEKYKDNDYFTLINKILLENEKYGIINSETCFTKNNEDIDELLSRDLFKKDYYIHKLNNSYINLINYCLNYENKLPKFVQYNILLKLNEIFNSDLNLYDDIDIRQIIYYLKYIIGNLDYDVISHDNYESNPHLKFYFKYLNDNKIELDDEGILFENTRIPDCENNLIIKKFKIEESVLTIIANYPLFFNEKHTIIKCEKTTDGEIEEYYAKKQMDEESERKVLSDLWDYKNQCKFKIHLDKTSECDLLFKIMQDETISTFPNIILEDEDKKYLIEDSFKSLFKDNKFHIHRAFRISVVMAVYNTEDYLSEAIDSIINQDINFEKHVQFIIVDDGSKDSSLDIALEYQEQYPDNILVLSQENSGQASARNNGLKHIKGRYVTFIDSDDYISKNAFRDAYNFFNKHDNQIDIVAMPLMHFGRTTGSHKLNYKFNKNRIIDLTKEPNNPQLSASSAFFKAELFTRYGFPTDVIFSEDAILINEILFEKKKYGVIKTANYYYRKRSDLSSTIDTVSLKKEYFTDKLKYYYMYLINYSLEKEGEVLKFIQYLLAYDLQWMIAQPELYPYEEEHEEKEFWYYLHKVISYLDMDVIKNNRTISNPFTKSYFITLKNNDLHKEIQANTVNLKSKDHHIDSFKNHNLWLDIIEIRNGFLTISGFINSHFDINQVSFEAIKENEDGETESFVGKYVKYTSREDVKCLSTTIEFKHNFDLNIKLRDIEKSTVKIRVNYHIDGDKNNFSEENLVSVYPNVKFTSHVRFSDISNYKISESKIISYENNVFYIEQYSRNLMKKLENEVLSKITEDKGLDYKEALRIRRHYMRLYPFLKDKKIFLFMDRESNANDNSTALFKYAVTQNDDVKKYLVLKKDAPEYDEVSKYGKILEYKSFEHKLMFLFADKIISTHPYESVINPWFLYGDDDRHFYSGLVNSKVYFLQHGVTKDNISSWFSKFDKNVSLVLTVSDKERESFFEEGYGYDEEVIQTLGFPRFDLLKQSSPKKQIIIIPTWRKNLRGNKNVFLNSDYFKSLNELLSNEHLVNIANKYGYKIIFKPHPELEREIEASKKMGNIQKDSEGEMITTGERYMDLFDIHEDIIISTEESYQDLFRDSALMITDYSSVYFDFAYLKKPLIYYQPNDDYHYGESYFEYETMGFGDIIKEYSDLTTKIEKYLSNDCLMEDKYIKRVDDFFKFNDDKNSQRVYSWIKEN